MQRLSGLDASFLYLETPSQPLHVCSILEVDTSTMPGGYRFERLRDELGARIASIPEFRQKLADNRLNFDHPAWVEDDAFDIDRHLHRIALPPPGGRVELSDICGRIASDPLDRNGPLWEMWVIEGIAGEDAQAGARMVVMAKVHHASVDGVTGADVLARLCGVEPDMPPPEPVEGPGEANSVQLAVSGLVNFATRPLRLASVVPTTVSTVVDIVRRVRSGRTMAVPFRAPRTPFNDAITRRRTVAYAEVDLADIKKGKNAARTLFAPALWLYTGTGLVRRPIHNVVISNVPGPQVPLYFLGCQVHAMYPLGPVFHGTGLNITAISLTGKLDIGIIACRELVSEVWRLADEFETALKELLDAAA